MGTTCYQEIIENEKARLDLFKWKVILVAGLGAAAAGLVGTQPIAPALPLALIPLVCIYVDLLCADLTLRIAVITRYLKLVHQEKGESPTDTEYAAFVGKADQLREIPTRRETTKMLLEALAKREWSAYGLAFIAQGISTFALSVGVIFWGCLFLSKPRAQFVVEVAVLGIVSCAWSYLEYKRRFIAVNRLDSIFQDPPPN
jgi:hypothetical protein